MKAFSVKAVRPFTSAMMLGFGAGVMLAATSFSLVVPGIEAAGRQGHEGLAGRTSFPRSARGVSSLA